HKTCGGRMVVPSSGLDRTNVGVIGGVRGGMPSGSSASSSMNAEKRICRPAVPLSEATLPASVLMSYFGAPALDERAATKAIAAAALMRVTAPAKPKQNKPRFVVETLRGFFIEFV